MTIYFPGPTPLADDVAHVLAELAQGRALELLRVDLKEEPGRRGAGGTIRAGTAQNESAAAYLAGEIACMANTPGGGALILGAADDANLIGTDLDESWLRSRLYELTGRRITPDIREVIVNGSRLLTILVNQAIEPVSYRGKTTWRVGASCHEVDAATILSGLMTRRGHDPSAEPTTLALTEAHPTALQQARSYLRAAGESATRDLAAASDADLLRRLGAVSTSGTLTVAGALLFTGRDTPALDYIRRRVPGGDSIVRLRESGLALLDELAAVERAVEAANEVMHVGEGLSIGKLRQLPARAAREAIVNGLAHRDWQSPDPTLVEHVGTTLTVTSPGGFTQGVTPSNIITHPSATRNRSLADMLAKLRIAEREGIGVDRMVRDMAGLGRPLPVIEQIEGPYVRTVLIGGRIDTDWVAFLDSIEPSGARDDLDAVLTVRHLVEHGWVDEERLAPVLQKSVAEAAAVLDRLTATTIDGQPLIRPVTGSPADSPSAYTFGRSSRAAVAGRLALVFSAEGRLRLAVDWVRERGRISSTELADIAEIAVGNAGTTLRTLAEEGALAPSRASARGRGLYYVLAEAPA